MSDVKQLVGWDNLRDLSRQVPKGGVPVRQLIKLITWTTPRVTNATMNPTPAELHVHRRSNELEQEQEDDQTLQNAQ